MILNVLLLVGSIISTVAWLQPVTSTIGARQQDVVTVGFFSAETNSLFPRTTQPLRMQEEDVIVQEQLPYVPLVVIAAAGLLVAAQILINRQAAGDQGLGAYLKDGSGFSRSGFRPLTKGSDRAVSSDPLPWLKLPDLDFVQVAGQDEKQDSLREAKLIEQLEYLRSRLNALLDEGRNEEAEFVRQDLESLMRESGMEFEVD